MSETLILIAAIFVGVGLAIFYRLRESRELKSTTKETLSSALRKEIEAEREEGMKRKDQFDAAMKDAFKQSNPDDR
jgi:hypothetical protein